MKLALAVIAKDQVEDCKRIIDDYGKYFDEIAIAYDLRGEEFELLSSDKVKVHAYQWCNDFAHKRNFLADKVESEYYFRIDTDDSIENAECIRDLFDRVVKEGVDGVYFEYMYSFDPDGNCNAKHWRETIIKKRADVYWKKSVHETLYIENVDTFRGIKDNSIRIIHNIDEQHADESNRRNFEILLEEFQRDKENTDPRTVGYIARVLMGMGLYDRATPFLELFLKKSGWDEDRYVAFCQLSEAKVRQGKYGDAIAAANEALSLIVDRPDAYYSLGLCYFEKGEFDKAVHWYEIGKTKPIPDTMTVINPGVYTFMSDMNMAMAYLQLGKYEVAYKYFNRAKEGAPNTKFITSKESLFVEAIENNTYLKNLLWMLNYSKKYDPKKCQNLVESIPQNMLKNDVAHKLRHQYLPARNWADNEIALFCGTAWEEWAPPSVTGGIGGSEEAVIYVSKELVKLGYEVTVFNNCGDFRGDYQGVKYRNWYEFNPNDNYNILIAWRGSIFNKDIKAKQRIVWLHDVPQDGQFTDENVEFIDKIMVLSEYHKSLLPPCVCEDKIFVSSNGINMDDFYVVDDHNPKRIIYTSSYDRGIEHLLRMWPDIRQEVPDAELHLFYGWNTYDKMIEQGFRPRGFRDEMTSLMNQDGVFEHGRVGHKQLVKEFAKSGIWAYPSHFEEISCISAMKAQACGCVPVYVNYAALQETVKDGVAIDGKAGDGNTNEEFKRELINLLKKPELQEVIRARVLSHKDQFGWDKVALQWKNELFQPQAVLV